MPVNIGEVHTGARDSLDPGIERRFVWPAAAARPIPGPLGIEGSVKEAAGKVEEGWGRAIDKPGTEADGEKRQVEGEVQKGWGETKDTVRDAVGKVKADLEDNDA